MHSMCKVSLKCVFQNLQIISVIFIMREMQNYFIVLRGPYVSSMSVSLVPKKWLLGTERERKGNYREHDFTMKVTCPTGYVIIE